MGSAEAFSTVAALLALPVSVISVLLAARSAKEARRQADSAERTSTTCTGSQYNYPEMVAFFSGLATIAGQEFATARDRNLSITRYLADKANRATPRPREAVA